MISIIDHAYSTYITFQFSKKYINTYLLKMQGKLNMLNGKTYPLELPKKTEKKFGSKN